MDCAMKADAFPLQQTVDAKDHMVLMVLCIRDEKQKETRRLFLKTISVMTSSEDYRCDFHFLRKPILKVLMWNSQQEFSERLYMGQKKGEN